jgi:hypothetical protein
MDRFGSWSCKNGLEGREFWKPGSGQRQATTASISGLVPTITRVRLYARTERAISVATVGSVLVRKCVAPMRAFIVPNGCSTVSRRWRMAFQFASRRNCTASSRCSCSHRGFRRSGRAAITSNVTRGAVVASAVLDASEAAAPANRPPRWR